MRSIRESLLEYLSRTFDTEDELLDALMRAFKGATVESEEESSLAA